MTEIAPRGGKGHQSIAPDTTAPSAPTITAPGAPSIAPPVPASHHRRQTEVQKKFDQIEQEFGGSKYLKHRRDDMKIRASPATPVTDAYTITIRPKDGKAPGLVSLDDLVIQREQRETEEWLRGEEYRATILPGRLQAERSFLAQQDYINRMSAEYDRARAEYDQALAEQAARDTEAQKYGYDTHEELVAAIRDEKQIKQANELGLALKETEILLQTVGREGYSGATREYGRDLNELIAEQSARAAAAQASLDKNFGVEIDPKHQEYFQYATDFTAAAAGRYLAQLHLDNALTRVDLAIQAGTPAADLPLLPDDILDRARDAGYGKNAVGALEAWGYHYTRAVTEAKVNREPVRTGSPGTLYDASAQAGLITAPIVGGTEIIQHAGTEFLEDWRQKAHRGVNITYPDDALQRQVSSGMVELGIGVAKSPFALQGLALTIPALEYAFRTPEEFSAALAPGAAKYISDLTKYATETPLQFTGELAGAALLLHGAGKVTGRVTSPISSRFTEAGIKIRAPAEHRAAIGAISDIGRNVPGLRSTVEIAPDLSKILNIGEAAPKVEAVITRHPHTIYGSTTELGQMPPKWKPSVSKDLDIFFTEPEAANVELLAELGPNYATEGTLITRRLPSGETVHAVDTHAYPPGYPVPGSARTTPRIFYRGDRPAPDLPFDFMPKELLRTGAITQEYLYTQALRKATSVMGEPEGLFRQRWRFGPEEHRMKDVVSLLGETEWLIESTKTRLPEMGRVEQFLTGRKVKKLETGVSILRKDPLVKRAIIEVGMKEMDVSPPTITISRMPSPRVRGRPEILSVLPTSPRSSPRKRSPSPSIDDVFGIGSLTISRPPRSRRSPSPGIVRSPSPGIIGSPSPGVAGSPSPGIVSSPSPGIFRSPSPGIIGSPSPGVAGSPSPGIVSSPSPGIFRSPSPGITGSPSPGRVHPPPPPPPPWTPTKGSLDPTKGKQGDEWYIHYADRPTPHARLEEAYTDLTGPKIRPAKMITNLERVIVGTPPKATRRKTTTTTTGRKVKRKTPLAPWDITLPAAPSSRKASKFTDPLNLFGTTPKRKKKSRRRR